MSNSELKMTTHQRLDRLWHQMMRTDRKAVRIHLDPEARSLLLGDEVAVLDGSLIYGPDGTTWRDIPIMTVALLPPRTSSISAATLALIPRVRCVTIEVRNRASRTLYLDDEDNGPEWMA